MLKSISLIDTASTVIPTMTQSLSESSDWLLYETSCTKFRFFSSVVVDFQVSCYTGQLNCNLVSHI